MFADKTCRDWKEESPENAPVWNDVNEMRELYYSVLTLRHAAERVIQRAKLFKQVDILSDRPDRRAKAYIAGHCGDALSLDETARAMHVSTFYFCKIFKKATGLTFTDYLGRVRVEKAKTLLLNPHLRVSEIAYTVGFQSLTHFNRIFRKITGEAPTVFREHLKMA
jgi:AraC-like DNA-binding protein